MPAEAYRAAFTDWLACASRGFSEPAARAASAAGDPIVALGTAGTCSTSTTPSCPASRT